jgi:tetrahydromethanopterin S-methyltransferase subunit F
VSPENPSDLRPMDPAFPQRHDRDPRQRDARRGRLLRPGINAFDVNLAARFFLELVGIGAVGYWGYEAVDSAPARIGLAAGSIFAFVMTWAAVVAPRGSNAIPQGARIAIGSGLLLLAASGLAVTGQPGLAAAFAAAIALNTVLLFRLGHDEVTRTRSA